MQRAKGRAPHENTVSGCVPFFESDKVDCKQNASVCLFNVTADSVIYSKCITKVLSFVLDRHNLCLCVSL